MRDPENYFDRFDIAPDADLTKPQGGMNRPRTRVELEHAAAPPPAPANYFDRFDGGDAPAAVVAQPRQRTWSEWLDQNLQQAGLMSPDAYDQRHPLTDAQRKAPATISAAPLMTLPERAATDFIDGVEHYSPVALASRALSGVVPSADTYRGSPGADNSQAAQVARARAVTTDNERDWRDMAAIRANADPIIRPGDHWYSPGSVARGAASLLGGAAGGLISDPTSLIAPGESLIVRMLSQGGVSAGVDALTQGGEMTEGVRDNFDPLQTAISAAAGTALVGAVEGIPALRQWWKQRGVNVDSVPDEALVSGSLDGTIGDTQLTGDQVNEILRGAGAPGMEGFSTPEAAAAAAQRVQAVQATPAPNLSTGMPAGLGSKRLGQFIDGAQPSPRAIPEDVSLVAAPEGAIRSDDAGAVAGLERKRAADATVLTEAQRRAADDPLVSSILDSNLSPQAKIATVWDRIARQGGDQPDLPDVPTVQPWTAPTPEAAANTATRQANPRRSRIHDITMSTESGGRRYGKDGQLLRSSAGAQGEMQVMPGTSRDPGYGVRPAQNDSPAELARVGRDYIDALQRHYDGDMEKAWAAYNGGPGAVDGAIAKHGRDWLQHMPAETRAYVNKNLSALGGGRELAPYRAGDYSRSSGGDYGFDAFDAGRPLRENTTANRGEAEVPETFAQRQAREGGPSPIETGSSTRPFRADAEGGDFEAIADASAKQQFDRSQADLEAEWDRRRTERAQREANRGADARFERERVRTEEASKGDPSGLYRGKYAQKPHEVDGAWRTTPEGFVAGADGKPVAFRSAREAASWAAKNKMGGDFELGTWATNSKRVVLQRREGSRYGIETPRPEGPQMPPAGRSEDASQRLLEQPAVERPVAAPPAPAGPVAPLQRMAGPEDALTFIARRGGLRDDEGHNLRGRSVRQGAGGRGLPQFAPGGGHLFRKNGLSIDAAGEALHEAGFFPTGRPTEAEVLDLLDRSSFDRQYRPGDAVAADEIRRTVEDHQFQERSHDELNAAAAAHGFTLSEPELHEMRKLMADGWSADDAYLVHHEREAAARLNEFQAETSDPEFDIPFIEDTPTNDRVSRPADSQAPEGARRSEDLGGGEGPSPAESGGARGGAEPRQSDAFGQRPGDERAALERAGEGRQRADVAQRAPGEDGGLFDTRDTTGDMFAGDAAQPARKSRLDSLDAVSGGRAHEVPDWQLDKLLRDGVVIRDKADQPTLTPKGRAELIRAGRSGGDGESGFIDLSDLGKLFRGNSPIDGGTVAEDMRAVGSKLRETVGSPKAALKASVARLAQFAEPTLYSADGALRSMAGRLNAPTLTRIADIFHARAGKAEGTARTFHEAVDIESRTRTQQVYDALEPHMGNKASMRRIRDLLARPTDGAMRASADERAAATKIRDMLKDVLEYRRDAGEELGEVSDGYFPRVIDAMAVAKKPDDFQQIATKLYRDLDVENPEAAAAAWARNIMDGYAGIDGGYDAVRSSTRPSSSKAREFGKAADAALADFYKQDPFDTLATYMLGSAKRAEDVRRFGPKGRVDSPERAAWVKEHGDRSQWDVMMDTLKDELRASGGDVDGVPREVLKLRDVNLGKLYAPAGNTVSMLHAWNTLSVMDRATISSLGDLAMGFVRGGPRYGFQHLGTSLAEFAREVARRPASEARRYAEAVGVANDAFGSALLHSRADSGNIRGKAAKMTDGFYRAIGLQQLTDAGRVAATKTGQHFLGNLAQDLEAGGRTAQRAAFYLRELGVQDPKAFGAQLRNGAPSVDALIGREAGFASDYATALMRYVNQSILMPARSERPKWAQHPVGSLFFALQSYSYGFAKNVVHRQARLAGEAARQRDPMMLASASGLLALAGLTYLNDTYLRPAVFGTRYDYADETPVDTALRVADRAGVLGPASQLVNMFKGFKYQREPTSALAGPVVGRLADGVYRGGKLAFYDNPNTDTDERNAAGAVYDLVVEPALDFGAVRYARGPARTAAVLATGNRYDNGVVPSDREAFVDGFGGPDETTDDVEE